LRTDCTDEDIRKYYRRQAVLVHPDKVCTSGGMVVAVVAVVVAVFVVVMVVVIVASRLSSAVEAVDTKDIKVMSIYFADIY